MNLIVECYPLLKKKCKWSQFIKNLYKKKRET